MNGRTHTLLLLALVGLFCPTAGGDILVYEGFATPGDYTNGYDLASQTGGGQGDWTDDWVDIQSNAAASSVTGSLTDTDLLTTAGSMSSPSSSRLHYIRRFTNEENLFCADGEVWFSALFKRTSGSNNFGITIASATSEYIGCGFRVNNFSSDVQASINGTLGTTNAYTSFSNGDTMLVVGRVSIDAGDTAGDHVVDIWVNPDLSVDLSTAALKSGDSWVDRAYAGFEASDRINVYCHQSNAIVYDEIRIGATFEDVAPSPNTPPVVDAGSDDSITLPASAELDATVSDDGLPDPPSVTVLWTKQSGPGTVTFDDDEAEDTTASFSADGTYVLRLTADDSELTAYDEVTITVNPAPTVGIITPAAAGGAATYYPLERAFDSQPTWDSQNEEPTGGGTSGYDCPTNVNRYGYIDFGADWQDVRITETWTLYKAYSTGNQIPYDHAYWDDDIDGINEDGVTEDLMNFNSAQGLSLGATAEWVQDIDYSTSPIVPQRRYLLLHSPTTVTYKAVEFAIIGYEYSGSNTPPSVDAGYDTTTTLSQAVNLDATVTDDDLPDPPAALTVTWTKLSGPGSITFGDANAVDTTATFGAEGLYLLRLSADDGEVVSYDELYVYVAPASPTLTIAEPQVFDYQQLTLVDEVICGDPQETHTLYESTSGISDTETILGSSCRVLPDEWDEPCYFGYIIGEDCDLEAGTAYVLVVEYPEDKPRSAVVVNHGCETNRCFHTGTTVGDALTPLYVVNNVESMNYGLTQAYRKWEMLFHLHDRFPDIEKPINDGERPNLPEDGFYVLIGQYASEEDPTSAGAAVKRIALYEAPSMASYTQELAELPEGLPKRHLFWREEMADGVVHSLVETERGVSDETDWFEYKFRICKFLGMNTYAKDLLEFGHPQGWDVSLYGGHDRDWFNRSATPFRWENILIRLAQGGYDLDVMPYYEYAGGDGIGDAALGRKHLADPLARDDDLYTQITWSERLNIDVTDPDAYTDATRLLQETVTIMAGGNRPMPIPAAGGACPTSAVDCWGYIDFGPDWQDVRICQTWTRSFLFHGGDASPFQAAYWHSTYSGFSGDTVPQGAIAENTINFITQDQVNGADRWSRDVDTTSSPITPQARYLVMRADDALTLCREFVIAGYINGQGTDLGTISVTAGSVDGFTMNSLFDNQPEFNNKGVNVIGAWFRPRVSAIPMGFADATTLVRFSNDLSISPAATRADLLADQDLLDDYYEWWFDQRKEFLNSLRDYLRTNVNEDAVIIYTWDHTEPGCVYPVYAARPDVVTDNVDLWSLYVQGPVSYDDAVSSDLHYDAMTLPIYNYSAWEWPHSVPRGDAPNYQDNAGVMMEYVYNQLYTVPEPDWFDEYRTESGLACIRHFALNEGMMTDSSQTELVGYYSVDTELAGPYCMLAEARAVAHGDPYYFGYLSGNSYNRCFPGYAREFNANFLALPALSSSVVANAASDSEVVVRRINTTSDGTWLAIVNTGLEDKEDVVITLPVSGTVTDAVTGDAITVSNGTITLDMWPGRLKSVHIDN